MDKRKDFGKMIAEARFYKKVSQEELAEKAGISQANLSKIENGKYSPGLDVLQRISEALDMELAFMKK